MSWAQSKLIQHLQTPSRAARTMAPDAPPHPLAPLSKEEFEKARDVVVKLYGPGVRLYFRCIFLHEPSKREVIQFLNAEHAGGTDSETEKLPPRLALVQYDVIPASSSQPAYTQSVIDVSLDRELQRKTSGPRDQTSFCP